VFFLKNKNYWFIFPYKKIDDGKMIVGPDILCLVFGKVK
jgi:hypothetical protein